MMRLSNFVVYEDKGDVPSATEIKRELAATLREVNAKNEAAK